MGVVAAVAGSVGRLFERTPSWARLLLAAVTVILGVAVLTRPTTSLGVLALLLGAGLVVHGVTGLATRGSSDTSGPRTLHAAVALGWIAAGLFVLVLPGLTVRLLVVVVGVGLVIDGAVSVAAAFRRGSGADERIADGALGLTCIILGILALTWPDITLLVISVTFGARLIMSGVVLARTVWRTHSPLAAQRSRGLLRRWTRTVAATVALLLAGTAAVVSGTILDGSPVVDDFYAAPRTVPSEPGRLVRAEPFTRGVPEDAAGWRILYTTTRGDGSPTVASGLVVVPQGEGPWPVIDWAHGTTGFAQNCAPSLATEPFESGALMVLPQILAEGWAVVATDYIGLGAQGPHPYLIGPDSAHATLDALRAARELDEAHLGDEAVVWGHSQGGGAALWTGALAASYAPEAGIDGVAALAPASDLLGLLDHLPDVTGGSVFASFVVAAYTAEYDNVTFRDTIRPGAEGLVRAMAARCLAEPGVLVSVLSALALTRDPDIFAQDPTTGAVGERLAQNVPSAGIEVPLLIAQGTADGLVVPSVQRGFVDGLCAAGQQVDYRTYAGRGHVELVQPDSLLIPDLIRWTHDRFDGAPTETGCTDAER